jgi:hypothetical protein
MTIINKQSALISITVTMVNHRTLYLTGQIIAGIDFCWLIGTFISVFIYELGPTTPHDYRQELVFEFFHTVALVSVLYFLERKNEEDPEDYTPLNLSLKNGALLVIPFVTDTRNLLRICLEGDFEFSYYWGIFVLALSAMLITVAACIWYLIMIYTHRPNDKSLELHTAGDYKKMKGSIIAGWHKLK